jgi:hypothetical protein
MIQLPRRSVTRFFIPLIDVLTLLFCIFLLMPVIQGADESDSDRLAREERLRQLEAELEQARGAGRDLPEQLRNEIEKLRQEKIKTLKERLAVRVLEIDGGTGRLYYYDPERVEVRNQADARALVERDRRERGTGQKELYYLILYPRVPSGYPTVGQREEYARWFEGVALGFDIPGAAPGGGQP